MNIGSIVTAPAGYRALSNNVDYYLVANLASMSAVVLAWFCRDDARASAGERWRADLLRLPRAEFEAGLESRAINVRENDHSYPPWLSELEGLDPSALEDLRVSRIRSYRDYASNRYRQIADLVQRIDELLAAQSIDAELAHHAAACTPRQRTARVRLWLCAYLAFGQDLYVLSPAFRGNGAWDRSKMADPNKKLGRPNRKNGPESGYSAIPLAGMIEASYLKHAVLGKHFCDIYADAMVDDFRCKRTPDDRGFYQPDGKSFPSLDQFGYHVYKRLGRPTVQRQKYGEARYRNKFSRSKGKFSEATGNVLESVEGDVNYLRERPRQLLSDKPGEPFATCRLICDTTGCTAGVGFSYRAERRETYEAALFFAVAPNALLTRLYGLEITDDDFPCKGLPRKYITDRGPGNRAVEGLRPEDVPPIRDLSPSWMGQSKAPVEASHPRHTKVDGAPTFIQSSHTIFELAKREILRAAADNRAKDCTARLTPEMIKARIPANPIGMVRYLTDRGRVDAVPMPLDRAVRAFLKQVEFRLDASGLWLYGLRYASDEFNSCELPRLPRGKQQLSINGYVAPVSVRLAWVECKGRLIEVAAQTTIRDDTQQLFISLPDLIELNGAQKDLASEQRTTKIAAKVAARDRFTEATGKHWSDGQQKSGRPPARGSRGGDVVPTQLTRQQASS